MSDNTLNPMESKKLDQVMSDIFGYPFPISHGRYYWAQSYTFVPKLQKYHTESVNKRGNIQFYFQFIHND